ncbi:MAG: hypothetical protein ACRDJX_00060 [Solirubrobacteraceae bacterium]
MVRTLFAGVVVATCWALGMLAPPGALAQETESFTAPGCTTWTVPAGVNRVLAEARGAAGYAGSGPDAGSGGDGDEVRGDVPVSAGEVLDVCVDYGGGLGGIVEDTRNAGSGGGASGLARGENFSAPLIIAGGGGGGGERIEITLEIPSFPTTHEVSPGGNGGNADSAGGEGKSGNPGGNVEGGSASNSAGPGGGLEGGFNVGHHESEGGLEKAYAGAGGGGGGGYVGGGGGSYPIGNGGGAGGTNFCNVPNGCATVLIPSSQTASVSLDYFGPPKVTLTTPREGATYTTGAIVAAGYSCEAEAGAELTSCVGTVPAGSPVPTSTTGPHSFTVTATQEDGEETSVNHTYTVVAPPPTCTAAVGLGVYKHGGEPGHLRLTNSLSTDLGAAQRLHVRYESGKIHFRLIKLEEATCTGEAGERDFHGEGAAAVGTMKGYTLSFSIYERSGGFFFGSTLMAGGQVVEASGGPLRKSTEKIS